MINISCVLKIGGCYDRRYVFALLNACKKYINEDFAFKCFTDDENFLRNPDEGAILTYITNKQVLFSIIRLEKNYKGWWSKFEIFKNKGVNLYFDLDTVIFGEIFPLIKLVRNLRKNQFVGLRPFNQRRRTSSEMFFGSGIMGWNGDFQFLLDEFDYSLVNYGLCDGGDQFHIHRILKNRNIEICYFQDVVTGIYSYKRNVLISQPENPRIVCFHGKPRPHEVGGIYWNEM